MPRRTRTPIRSVKYSTQDTETFHKSKGDYDIHQHHQVPTKGYSVPHKPLPEMAKLYAIADIHLGHPLNTTEWSSLRPQPPGSGLIIAGDVGESAAHLRLAFEKAKACFTHVFWVPGNHELYTMPSGSASAPPASASGDNSSSTRPQKEEADALRGESKYLAFVALAQSYGVLTPEDPWMVWEGPGHEKVVIALIFTLYDYSFRPSHVSRENALAWAREEDIEATDEALLHPDPYAQRDEWCGALCNKWEAKFRATARLHQGIPFVIVNHWPLREGLVHIPLVPRFSLWCGTKRTEEWHRKGYFGTEYAGAKVVVTGHLHVRRSDVLEGCRFEEVSLGYPRQWSGAREQGKGVNELLREILPGPEVVDGQATIWRRYG